MYTKLFLIALLGTATQAKLSGLQALAELQDEPIEEASLAEPNLKDDQPNLKGWN
jgi:hypothetical protein